MYFTFAWRYFKAKKSAHAINIIAWVTLGVIAFATACQVLVLSVFNGFEDLVKSLYSSFYTDIRVVPVKGKTFLLNSDRLKQIREQPYVSHISLVAEEKALLQNRDGRSQTVVYLKGVDDNYANVSGVAASTNKGAFNTGTADEPGLILGSGVQNRSGVNVNMALPADSLTVIMPKRNSLSNDPLQSLSEGNAKATGVFTIQQDFDDNYALTNIDFVKQQMGLEPDEYSAVEMKLIPKQDPREIKIKLQRLLGDQFLVRTRYEQNTNLYNTMELEKWAIYAILTLIMILSAFNMIGALRMLVLEKQKDISVLQSMGTTRASILKIFLAEGLLLGGLGAIAGILMAVIACLIQVKFKLVKLEGGSFLINYFPVKMLPGDFILVASTALLITFIAAWFPAWKASRQLIELR